MRDALTPRRGSGRRGWRSWPGNQVIVGAIVDEDRYVGRAVTGPVGSEGVAPLGIVDGEAGEEGGDVAAVEGGQRLAHAGAADVGQRLRPSAPSASSSAASAGYPARSPATIMGTNPR